MLYMPTVQYLPTMDGVVLLATTQIISSAPLEQVVELAQSQILRLELSSELTLPAKASLLYLHIHSHPQHALPIIQQLLTDEALVIDQNPSYPLPSELLYAMIQAEPHLVERCLVDQHKEGMFCIDRNNQYAISNLVRLSLLRAKGAELSKRFELVRDYTLPLYISHAHIHLQKSASEMIEEMVGVITAESGRHMKELMMFFTEDFHRYWKDEEISDKNIAAIESHLSLIERLHGEYPYGHELTDPPTLKQQVKQLLTWKGEGTGHRLGAKVYEHYAQSIGSFNTTTQLFLRLYGALSCYGAHLARDAWPSFFALLQQKQASVYGVTELAEVLLLRVEKHDNANVIKNCTLAMIQSQESSMLFQVAPQLVYGRVVKLLGLGSQYLDCYFHMDSKMYNPVRQFFIRYLNQPLEPPTFEFHLSSLLSALIERDSYDHALIAMFGVFGAVTKRSQFLRDRQMGELRTLLIKGYPRFPLRKRFQLLNSLYELLSRHLCWKEVDVDRLSWLLVQVNPEYYVNGNQEKNRRLFEGYGPQVVQQWVACTIKRIAQGVQRGQNGWEARMEARKVERLIKPAGINLSAYYQFLIELLQQYGQSQYKTEQERTLVVQIYNIAKQSILQHIPQQHIPQHLEQVCNNLVHLGNSSQSNDSLSLIRSIASFIFSHAYRPTTNNEPQRVVVARMLEWAYDALQNKSQPSIDVILQALRGRTIALRDRRLRPDRYKEYEVWLEETLYALNKQLSKYDAAPSQSCLSGYPAGKRMRLRVLLGGVLISDPACPGASLEEIADFIDCYDFQYYEQVCWWVEATYSQIASRGEEKLRRRINEEEAQGLVRQLSLMLDNMLHNMEYSLGSKQVQGIVECSTHLFFLFAKNTAKFSLALSQFLLQLFRVGESSILFHRVLVLTIGNFLQAESETVGEWQIQHLIPVVVEALTVEEYRGFDSAVLLQSSVHLYQFYQSFSTDLESCYLGATPRFSLLHLFHSEIIPKATQSEPTMKLVVALMEEALKVCSTPVAKERMFLSGKNKTRLQMWQFLLAFPPMFFPRTLSKEKLAEVLTVCLEGLSLTTIGQIRSYSDLFTLRLLFACPQAVTKQMLKLLQEGMLGTSANNINKCLSYMVITGLFLQHLARLSGLFLQHLARLSQQYSALIENMKSPLQSLFNSLLTFVGSSVAYLRGLSQYFCLTGTPFLSTPYLQLLRQSYLFDKDALVLGEKLQEMLERYRLRVKEWRFDRQVLRRLPNNNGNVTQEDHFIEGLRLIGTKITQANKNEDGYTAYRNIWRKNVPVSQQEQEGQDEEDAEEEIQQGSREEGTLQTKIDPAVDLVRRRKSHLQIMLVSPNSYVLAGHLSRTGEIFGLSRLILPESVTVNSEQFKSISVTAEKWLDIVGLDSGGRYQEVVRRKLIECKNEGYGIIRLRKSNTAIKNYSSPELGARTMVVIDEEGLLERGCLELLDGEVNLSQHLSTHVEASILIWEHYS